MAENIEVSLPLPSRESLQLLEPRVTELIIENAAGYAYWCERLKTNKGAQTRVEAAWKALKAPLLLAIDRLAAFFSPLLRPMQSEEDVIKCALIEYNKREQVKRDEAQAAAFRAADQERAKLQRQVDRANAKGDTDRANALEQQQLMVVAPVVPASTPKVSGAVYREVWTYRIVDASKVPDTYKKLDEVKIRRQVNATRSETSIPGIEVYKEMQLAVRGST